MSSRASLIASSSTFFARDVYGQVGTRGLDRFPLLDRLLDLLLDLVEVDVEVLQDRGRDAFAFADEAEQDVLRAHVFVVESLRLLPCHLEDLSNPLGEVVAVHSPSNAFRSVTNRTHLVD